MLKRSYQLSDGKGSAYEISQTLECSSPEGSSQAERDAFASQMLYGLFTRVQIRVKNVKFYRGAIIVEPYPTQ